MQRRLRPPCQEDQPSHFYSQVRACQTNGSPRRHTDTEKTGGTKRTIKGFLSVFVVKSATSATRNSRSASRSSRSSRSALSTPDSPSPPPLRISETSPHPLP